MGEGLPPPPIRKMEAGAPAPLVELRRQVVVRIHQVGVLVVAVVGLVLIVQVVVSINPAVALARP